MQKEKPGIDPGFEFGTVRRLHRKARLAFRNSTAKACRLLLRRCLSSGTGIRRSDRLLDDLLQSIVALVCEVA